MKKNLPAITILLATGFIISIFLFEPVLQNPNSFLFSKSGDAVKSYFNFSYYLRYDEGFRHDGINYPYGDHLQYINSHPLYVNMLKFIDRNIISISDYGPGILNLSMIFSIVLALPFLFLILRRFSLPVWYSVIISLILIYLTPQFDRIHGHFEMVYAFFLPVFWYLLIKFLDGKRKTLWASLLILSGLVGGFTSAYYVAIYAIFILAVFLVKLWDNRKRLGEYKWQAVSLFALAIIPIILVRGVVGLTDWANDRPDNPWGFFIFHSNVFSIFLPFTSTIREALGDPGFLRFQWEGRAYVGFPATITALLIGLTFIYSLFSRDKFQKKSLFPDQHLNIYLAASVIVLLFSMAFPFKYGLAFLKDLIPPLKQFRALGRFSWIFYYVFTVYTAYLVYVYFRFFRLKKLKSVAFTIMVLVISYWAIDTAMNIRRSTRNLFNNNDLLANNTEEYNDMLRKGGVNIDDYQAILFLPFANTCGDKLLFTGGMEAFNQAMKCSYHTSLPLIQSFSPRLPFSDALSSIQMLADPAIPKSRLDDMNEKPILVLKTEQELTLQERKILDMSQEVFSYGNISLSRLLPSDLRKRHSEWQERAKLQVEDLAQGSGSFSSDTLTELIVYKSFDSFENPRNIFKGEGAFYLNEGKEFIISRDEFQNLPPGEYQVTFWLYVDTRTDNMPEGIFYVWDEEGNQLKRNKWNTREEHNVYRDWVRVDQLINIEADLKYGLEIKGKYISLDELLLQPAGSNVHVNEEPGMSTLNNYPLI